MASLFSDLMGMTTNTTNCSSSNSSSPNTNGSSPQTIGIVADDQRALHLAFELSMLGLTAANTTDNENNSFNLTHLSQLKNCLTADHQHNLLNNHHHHHNGLSSSSNHHNHHHNLIDQLSQIDYTNKFNNLGMIENSCTSDAFGAFSTSSSSSQSAMFLDERSKKSQNMTECVPVPSSEHVAEIVGRQGCKIKALRAKTNTYIKTPVRGEEPVFVVTGRKEDVAKAKLEILSAAEHFSLIRASRKPNGNSNSGSMTTLSGALSGSCSGLIGSAIGIGGTKIGQQHGPPAVPGQITTQVRVPYRVVGLVVGPKGATIKHIQQLTDTYIVTPSRDKEPVFEVTGQPDNVEVAERQIKAHIEMRTGQAAQVLAQNGLGGLLNDENGPDLLATLYKNGLGSLLGFFEPQNAVTNNIMLSGNGGLASNCSSASSTSSKCALMTQPELISIWKSLGGESAGNSCDIDEGIGESPNIWSMATPSGIRSSPLSASASASPTDSLLGNNTGGGGAMINNKRECLVCGDKEVTAALVPCGHNLFCLECANRICMSGGDALCPVCSQTVIQAIRILG